MHDRSHQEITSQQISRSMRISHISGGLGILWLVTATPQQILTVFVRNHLGASPTQLGLLVGAINIMAVLHLASIWFYRRLQGRKKPFFMITTVIQRCMAFAMSYAAFSVAGGGSRQLSVLIVLAAAIVAGIAGNISGSGWWTWMADLIPENRRAAFFGTRSAISQVVNVVFFFSATLFLDLYARQVFVVYGILFAVGGIGGILDVLLHAGVPEPQPAIPPDKRWSWSEFLLPVKDRNFRSFCGILGLYLFSMNLAAPFLAPYMTAADGGGAPNVWLGITFVISQSVWVLMAPFWGMLMDRMGKKPVVIIGGLFVLSWLGYLILSPGNYIMVLPVIALVGGLLAPAFWEGISQFMLALSPDSHRTSYSAWYWTAFGLSGAVSPLLGGLMYDYLDQQTIQIVGMEPSAFQLVVIVSVLLVLFSLTHMGRIVSPRDKSVRTVMSTILNPGVFRAVSNIAILSRPTRADVVRRTLHGSRGGALGLSFAEICVRLDDPDVQVREAAALALARLGSRPAQMELIQRLQNRDSLSRPVLTRALGNFRNLTGDELNRVVQVLSELLSDPNEDVQVEAASSLGRLAWRGATPILLRSLRESPSLRVRISSAEAAARLGAEEAGIEIFQLMHQTENWILRRQLAIALGDLFGNPGEIYFYMTGDMAGNLQAVHRLAELAGRRIGRALRSRRVMQPIPADTGDIVQQNIRVAADLYDRERYTEAYNLLIRVWQELPWDAKLQTPRVMQVYWEELENLQGMKGAPASQDVVLALYSLYRVFASK
ncbi:MAG: MFS transporter [Spirochaeta sp.]